MRRLWLGLPLILNLPALACSVPASEPPLERQLLATRSAAIGERSRANDVTARPGRYESGQSSELVTTASAGDVTLSTSAPVRISQLSVASVSARYVLETAVSSLGVVLEGLTPNVPLVVQVDTIADRRRLVADAEGRVEFTQIVRNGRSTVLVLPGNAWAPEETGPGGGR